MPLFSNTEGVPYCMMPSATETPVRLDSTRDRTSVPGPSLTRCALALNAAPELRTLVAFAGTVTRNVPESPVTETFRETKSAQSATCRACPLRFTVPPSAMPSFRSAHAVSAESATYCGRPAPAGAPDDEPTSRDEAATTHAGRADAAPSVKSVVVTFSYTTPFARSKSAPFPAAVRTGTRSRTTMPPSFTRMESKRNLALYVTARWSANTQRSMNG